MADYYSILKKTIASLPESNGAARRNVYARARTAIVNQLKAYEPPLAPSEITGEQLRLEEAIRKVEAEAARESLGLGARAASPEAPAASPAPEPAAVPVAEPIPDASSHVEQQPIVEAPASKIEPEITDPRPAVFSGAAGISETEQPAAAFGDSDNLFEESNKPETPQVVEPETVPSTPDADGLFEQSSDEQPVPSIASELEKTDAGTEAPERVKRPKRSASEALKRSSSDLPIFPIAGLATLAIVVLVGVLYFVFFSDDETPTAGVSTPGNLPQTSASDQAAPPPAIPEPAEPSSSESAKNTDRLLSGDEENVVASDARTVTTTLITPPVGQPIIEQSAPSSESESANQAGATGEVEAPPAVPVQEENFASVSPTETAPETPTSEAETSAQRSILYEEGEEASGAGTAAQGAVVWTVDEERGLDGRTQSILSANVEIPERDLRVIVRIKPNDDTSLPASHLVEIKYELPESFASGDVVNVPGLVMKPTEEARGDALVGASVKVSPGFFWIALSSLPNEQQRNMVLLRDRGWIDIPMLYENGKRGILTLEKGTPGTQAVERAISAWRAG